MTGVNQVAALTPAGCIPAPPSRGGWGDARPVHVKPMEGPESPGGTSWNDAAPRGLVSARDRIPARLASASPVSAVTYRLSLGKNASKAPHYPAQGNSRSSGHARHDRHAPRVALFLVWDRRLPGPFRPAAATNPSRRTNQCRSTHAPWARYQERVIQGSTQHETGTGPTRNPTPVRKEAGMPITNIYPGEESM